MSVNAVSTVSLVIQQQGFDKANKSLDRYNKNAKAANDSSGSMNKRFANSSKVAGVAARALLGVAAAAAAAASAVAAFTVAQANAYAETKRMADQSELSVLQFQALGVALAQSGVSAEKFADISKDVKDRLGEFITTGSGAFNDFKDVIGLSNEQALNLAKSMQTMSGRDGLALVVEKMESAGASTSQMKFAMEALAGDASLLIPLLRNNASELTRLETNATRVLKPLQLTTGQSAAMAELAEKTSLLTEAVAAAGTKVASVLAPALSSMIDDSLNRMPELTGKFNEFVTALSNTIKHTAEGTFTLRKDIRDTSKEATEMLSKIQDAERRGLMFIPGTEGNFGPGERVEAYKQKYIELTQKLTGYHNELNALVRTEETANTKVGGSLGSSGTSTSTPSSTSTVTVPPAASGSTIDFLQLQKDQQAQLERDSNAARLAAMQESFMTERELMQAEYEERTRILETARENGNINLIDSLETEMAITKDYNAQKAALMQKEEDIRVATRQKNLGKIASLEKSSNKTLAGIGAAATALLKAEAIKQSIISIQSGIAQAMANPFPANLGFAATVAAEGASIISTLQGVAHGGLDSVPNEGTFLLQKGERVIKPEQNKDLTNFLSGKGSGGSGMVVNNNITIQQSDGESQDALAQRVGQELERKMRNVAQNEIMEQQRSGNMLNQGVGSAF